MKKTKLEWRLNIIGDWTFTFSGCSGFVDSHGAWSLMNEAWSRIAGGRAKVELAKLAAEAALLDYLKGLVAELEDHE